ncbi:MAG: FAD-dependent oxidoreductase [Blastochloris sp.]|nr:FAD-dependent oxidoreductase [Blastochloris sp.]
MSLASNDLTDLHYYFPSTSCDPRTVSVDCCIYGGNSAGMAAAVTATRLGLSVVVVEPSAHLGGLSAGGLGNTDIGNKHAIGGLSREFYRQVGRHYEVEEEWRFEPQVAESIFEQWVEEHRFTVFKRSFLAEIRMEGNQLKALVLESGLTIQARIFLDCSYEGDLLARAGVSYTVGREANAVYGETLNGVQVRDKHQFDYAVDPYVVEGVPGSGLLPGIESSGPLPLGSGDHRVQAYNFRMCLTQRDDIRVPFTRPEGYDDAWYVLLARYLAGGWNENFRKFDLLRGNKTDTNNHGPVSTDWIGQNHDWPEANYARREQLFQGHVRYQQGLFWFLTQDPRVPRSLRESMQSWGLAADEFVHSGHWPHALYVREARRMVSDWVMTEHECRGERRVPDAIALAAYTMDSHNCRRFVQEGRVWNDGDLQVAGFPPYSISYRSVIPKRGECGNLLVPVCLSASHIAYGSIRMEPVFMILGQSAATAAFLALKNKTTVQDLAYDELKSLLLTQGQILELNTDEAVQVV